MSCTVVCIYVEKNGNEDNILWQIILFIFTSILQIQLHYKTFIKKGNEKKIVI